MSKNSSLQAMQYLPNFLENMIPKHPQAAKLHNIAASLVRQARTVLHGKLSGDTVKVAKTTTSKDTAAEIVTTSTFNMTLGDDRFPKSSNVPPYPQPTSTTPSLHQQDADKNFFFSFFDSMPATIPDSSPSWTDPTLGYDSSMHSEVSGMVQHSFSKSEIEQSPAITDASFSQGHALSDIVMQSNFDWFSWDNSATTGDVFGYPFSGLGSMY